MPMMTMKSPRLRAPQLPRAARMHGMGADIGTPALPYCPPGTVRFGDFCRPISMPIDPLPPDGTFHCPPNAMCVPFQLPLDGPGVVAVTPAAGGGTTYCVDSTGKQVTCPPAGGGGGGNTGGSGDGSGSTGMSKTTLLLVAAAAGAFLFLKK